MWGFPISWTVSGTAPKVVVLAIERRSVLGGMTVDTFVTHAADMGTDERPRHPRVIRTSRGGFTLVELLVTLVVAVLLAAGAFTILGSQVSLYTVQAPSWALR